MDDKLTWVGVVSRWTFSFGVAWSPFMSPDIMEPCSICIIQLAVYRRTPSESEVILREVIPFLGGYLVNSGNY